MCIQKLYLKTSWGLSSESYVVGRNHGELGGGEGLSLKYGVRYWQKCGEGNKAVLSTREGIWTCLKRGVRRHHSVSFDNRKSSLLPRVQEDELWVTAKLRMRQGVSFGRLSVSEWCKGTNQWSRRAQQEL